MEGDRGCCLVSAVKDAIVWVVTHPNPLYVAGVMAVGASC